MKIRKIVSGGGNHKYEDPKFGKSSELLRNKKFSG